MASVELPVPHVTDELASMGSALVNPQEDIPGMTSAFPQGGIPFELPAISAPEIISQPMFQDQTFQPTQLMVQSTTAITSNNLVYDIQTTTSEWLMLEEVYFSIQGSLQSLVNVPPALNGLSTNMIGNRNSNVITTFGSIFSIFNSITISVNGLPLPNFQQNYLQAQLYTSGVMCPQNYDINTVENQINRLQKHKGKLGLDQYEIITTRGNWGTDVDMTLWTNTPISLTVPQFVYLRIPIRKILYCFAQLGRFWTSDAKITIAFQLQNLFFDLTMVSENQNILAPYGAPSFSTTPGTGVPIPANAGILAMGQQAIQSLPARLTLNRIQMEFGMVTPQQWLIDSAIGFNRQRPLTLNVNNVQSITDPAFPRGYSLGKTDSTGWGDGTGSGMHRNTLRSTGILAKFFIGCPLVTLTWANSGVSPNITGPWRDASTTAASSISTWTRTFLCPGLIYPRRLYLAGQSYGSDLFIDTYGEQLLASIGTWWTAQDYRVKSSRQFLNNLGAANLPYRKDWDHWKQHPAYRANMGYYSGVQNAITFTQAYPPNVYSAA